MNSRQKSRISCSTGVALVVTAFCPVRCHAAADYTLIASKGLLTSYIALVAIWLALSGAIVLYALGGRDERAGRLLGSALGGCIAPAIVHLLNDLLPGAGFFFPSEAPAPFPVAAESQSFHLVGHKIGRSHGPLVAGGSLST